MPRGTATLQEVEAKYGGVEGFANWNPTTDDRKDYFKQPHAKSLEGKFNEIIKKTAEYFKVVPFIIDKPISSYSAAMSYSEDIGKFSTR